MRRLASFGAYSSGVHRPTFSAPDMAARHWLVEQMREAGLAAEMDGIGNIIARNPRQGRRLLMGSHSDSQNHAGWLDGALGVIYALEIARSHIERGHAGAIDPVVWADEEAHYASFLGSRSAIGALEENEIEAARDATTGLALRQALADAGLAGMPRMHISAGDYVGYIEAHIEQGDHLDSAGLRIGVVTSIVGIYQYRITVSGARNHAGTTSMERRRDASRTLIRLAAQIDARIAELAAERTVWTVGNITVEPGQVSIIPDRSDMLLQVRDADPQVLVRIDAALRELVDRCDGGCPVTLGMTARSEPHRMDEGMREALRTSAEQHVPGDWVDMPSGAGHDAQILAGVMPAAMLFVPSIGGISHHWTENTKDEDIVLGCQVMADAAYRLLAG
ncbi:hydantoinase/carbamoylase family amidase [Devosia naphthalenivorans]|uniref:hydantoinase/carbamoylase family amidase n=1 Tax=Devosia naphthalenivorans TaxID=2082392 RepID=UPI00318338D8